jgi:L-seryl-tRNA(Ser) seleniumtransferase
MTSSFQSLPSVDRLLLSQELGGAITELGRETVKQAVRDELEERRQQIASGGNELAEASLLEAIQQRAYSSVAPSLKQVINATGVIIHTNLGRAPLSDATVEAMATVGRSYSNLEFDLESGGRGSRYDHLEQLLVRVTGAEAAMAVNNNAAALLLALSALCQGREVLISRGQLIEIGGGFRVPDVMAQSGAKLVEVGTTNRTRLSDYSAVINENTAALMRVHESNFRVIGFTESVGIEELASLAQERGVLAMDDLGSGCLIDPRPFGLVSEPMPQASLRAGADLVFFSGDKLLGGPQAGIIAGSKDLIATLRRHPLARVLRLDKTSIAGLNATLLHYVKGEATREVPVWRMIAMPIEEMDQRASRWAHEIGSGSHVVDGVSMIGGGSLPGESLPTRLLSIPVSDRSADDFARALRGNKTPVVGRIDHDELCFDPRTVDRRQDETLIDALQKVLRGERQPAVRLSRFTPE